MIRSHYALPLVFASCLGAEAASQTGIPPGYIAAIGTTVALMVAVVKGYRWVDGAVDAKLDRRFTAHEQTNAAELRAVHAKIDGLRDLILERRE